MITGTDRSGLKYAVRRSGSAVGYCSLSIKCGTRDEEGFHSGIAHFTEHTMFKGTMKKSASCINSYLDRLGGELNAYTTKEEIVLHATTLREDLSKAASLLLELATQATFPAKEVETEKGVVIDEILSYKDSPADDVYDRFEEALFAGHPLARPILGTAAAVRKTDSDELGRFARLNFTPGRMAFTMVADLDEARMEKMILRLSEKFFPGGETLPESVLPAAAVPFNRFDRTVDKRRHEANAVIGALAPSLYAGQDRIASVLLANILGGPASNSLLGSILRERNGWVYGVECGYTQYRDTGIMAVSLGCDKENLDKCLTAVDKALAAFKEKPMSERALKAAKKQMIGQLAISSESGEAQCLSMGKSLLSFGRIASDEQNRASIEAVTAEDLQRLASQIFDPDSLSRLIYL